MTTRTALLIGVWLSLTQPGLILAQASDPRARLKSVQTLVETSSGARQIQASDNPQAKAKHEQARSELREARQALQAGRRQAADEAILRATRSMLEAVRLADQQAVVADKRRADFQHRLDSVNALLDAHQRVGDEKDQQGAVRELRRIVDGKIAKAESLLAQGEFDQAHQVLDQTYVAVKTAIERLRGGDTLVRTLNFANKEEEYRYELDRNDTHQMLVKVLLEEKLQDPKIGKLVKQFMAKAAKLRAQGERQASRGDYAAAVSTLEGATKEVVRAIRSAGIYIPG